LARVENHPVCPRCRASAPDAGDRYCSCGVRLESPPPRPALLVGAYLVGAFLAYGAALISFGLDDDPSHPMTGEQVDAAVRMGTIFAVAVTVVGTVVMVVPTLRRRLGIRGWGRVALADAVVYVGTLVGVIAGS
jgi:hypothetical protein